jgi:hypothetical protein
MNRDLTLLCEFEGICLKSEEDLLDPILISLNYWTLENTPWIILRSNSLENRLKLQTLVYCFLLLYLHDLVYSLPNVEYWYVFPELASLNLWIVEEVLDHRAHQIRGGLLNVKTIIELKKNFLAIRGINVVSREIKMQLVVKIPLQNILSLNRIQWVS